jgi:hypothetical protein
MGLGFDCWSEFEALRSSHKGGKPVLMTAGRVDGHSLTRKASLPIESLLLQNGLFSRQFDISLYYPNKADSIRGEFGNCSRSKFLVCEMDSQNVPDANDAPIRIVFDMGRTPHIKISKRDSCREPRNSAK